MRAQSNHMNAVRYLQFCNRGGVDVYVSRFPESEKTEREEHLDGRGLQIRQNVCSRYAPQELLCSRVCLVITCLHGRILEKLR